MGSPRDTNGGQTWQQWRALIDSRLRRLELIAAALVVATASPKLGAPSVPQAVYWVVNNVGHAGFLS